MIARVLLEPVFVLHHRPYQNSSLIVDFFSKEQGRITAIARSARGPKSRFKGCLQLFSPLLASWSGRQELMNLNHIEFRGAAYQLNGQGLMCAFYLNELLLRLIPRHDPYPEIFAEYQMALQNFEQSKEIASVLRKFEKHLLEGLGYGLSFNVNEQELYRWLPEQGFVLCQKTENGKEQVFSGRSLLALQAEEWNNPEDLLAAKHLMRLILGRYLGQKPIKSRELFF